MNLISYLGFSKDNRGDKDSRWEKFRPTIACLLHPELNIKRLHLLYHPKYPEFLEATLQDIKLIRPDIEVNAYAFNTKDDFDPAAVFENLSGFIDTLPSNEEYLVNSVTGSDVFLVGWFDLIRMNRINGKLLQIFQASKERRGDSDYDKRAGHYRIIDLNLSKYDSYRSIIENLRETDKVTLKDGITTKNDTYNKLIGTVERVAVRNNYPILITGETGVGKTELAKRLYRLKKNKGIVGGEFCYVNCATLNRESALSTLFGHKKGAYTGALSNRDGLLKSANNGMLFLDEIGCLPMDVQGMLLHALEDGCFTPLGSDVQIQSSFSLICGTNDELLKAVEAGTFRRDLLARIKLWSFNLPPLRDRKEDIEPNIVYELSKYQAEHGNIIRFTQEAHDKYLSYALNAHWACNFRDLSDSIKRMATLCDLNTISESDVDDEIERLNEDIFGSQMSPIHSVVVSRDFISELFSKMGKVEPELSKVMKITLNGIIQECLLHPTAKDAALSLYGECGKNPTSRLSSYLSTHLGVKFKDIKTNL